MQRSDIYMSFIYIIIVSSTQYEYKYTSILIDNRFVLKGQGSTKKAAKHEAAEGALKLLKRDTQLK